MKLPAPATTLGNSSIEGDAIDEIKSSVRNPCGCPKRQLIRELAAAWLARKAQMSSEHAYVLAGDFIAVLYNEPFPARKNIIY